MLWLLEELAVPYEVKRYERSKETMLAPPELRAVHPLGKSPLVTDDGATVAESGAILEYIVEKYGDGRFIPPAGTPERLRYRYWTALRRRVSAMPPLLLKLIFDKIETSPMPFFVRPCRAKGISAKVKQAFIGPQIQGPLRLHGGRAREGPRGSQATRSPRPTCR